MFKRKLAAGLAALAVAVGAVAPFAVASVSQNGRTATANAAFKFGSSTVNGPAHIQGQYNGTNQALQVRIYDATAGAVMSPGATTYQLAAGANYNSDVTIQRTCGFGTLHSYVTQARLVTGTSATPWDSAPGQKLTC